MNEIEKPIQSTEARETIVPPEQAAQEAAPPGGNAELNLPEGALILLPTRNAVLFPGIVAPLTLGRPQSIAGAQAAAKADKPVGVILQKDASIETPGPDDLHGVGTTAEILRYVTSPDGSHHLVSRGTRRFRVREFLPGYPFLVARVEEVGEAEVYSTEIAARMHQLKERAREAISLLPNVPTEIAGAIDQIQSPSQLADFIANVSDLTPKEKQDVLETFDVTERLDKLLRYLAQQIEVLRLSKQIGEQTQEELSGRQREHILREQLRQIQKELGEGEEGKAEIAELREAIDKAGMSEEAEKQALKELKRLERMPEASAEHGMIRSYLDWLIELPWSKTSEDRIDIAEARRILDEDHYGLPKVKQRILEYLAVRKLKPDGKSPILCFVGPPGVGKTSLGQSIARAMGRKFGRISLGGVHDEAEIRGHRRIPARSAPALPIQLSIPPPTPRPAPRPHPPALTQRSSKTVPAPGNASDRRPDPIPAAAAHTAGFSWHPALATTPSAFSPPARAGNDDPRTRPELDDHQPRCTADRAGRCHRSPLRPPLPASRTPRPRWSRAATTTSTDGDARSSCRARRESFLHRARSPRRHARYTRTLASPAPLERLSNSIPTTGARQEPEGSSTARRGASGCCPGPGAKSSQTERQRAGGEQAGAPTIGRTCRQV